MQITNIFIPKDILNEVLKNLDLPSLKKTNLVNKCFHQMVNNNRLYLTEKALSFITVTIEDIANPFLNILEAGLKKKLNLTQREKENAFNAVSKAFMPVLKESISKDDLKEYKSIITQEFRIRFSENKDFTTEKLKTIVCKISVLENYKQEFLSQFFSGNKNPFPQPTLEYNTDAGKELTQVLTDYNLVED